MNCPGCGFEVQSGFAFCPKCGAKQPSSCPGCGYVRAPDFAFCPKCGTKFDDVPPPTFASAAPIATRSPARMPNPAAETAARPTPGKADTEANRRTITVLFADLCGFTTMSERLDPEVVQALQNELFEELTEAVQSFGGFVDKFIGDALL